jgi:hypothetical protein
MTYTSIIHTLSDEDRKNYIVRVKLTINTIPLPQSINMKVNPPRYFFGYYSICLGDQVVSNAEIQFPSQLLLLWQSPDAQLGAAASSNQTAGAANSAQVTQLDQEITALVALLSFTPTTLTPVSLSPSTPTPVAFSGCPYDNVKVSLIPTITDYTITTLTTPAGSPSGYTPQWLLLSP